LHCELSQKGQLLCITFEIVTDNIKLKLLSAAELSKGVLFHQDNVPVYRPIIAVDVIVALE
jgi:hypothetical protein